MSVIYSLVLLIEGAIQMQNVVVNHDILIPIVNLFERFEFDFEIGISFT